ncbi:MAG: hypothetical protein K2J82_03115, partial [Muribaculaceae bacterium]|nr:hypothetical protein [Muribaculaceae bacterium]
PDSNWCERFCRPVPNHSDMAPNFSISHLFGFASAKLALIIQIAKFLSKYFNYFFILNQYHPKN